MHRKLLPLDQLCPDTMAPLVVMWPHTEKYSRLCHRATRIMNRVYGRSFDRTINGYYQPAAFVANTLSMASWERTRKIIIRRLFHKEVVAGRAFVCPVGSKLVAEFRYAES